MQCMYFVYLQNMSTVLKYNKICLIDSCWFNRGRYPLSCRNYDINLIHLIVCILMVGFCVYDRENYLDWAVIFDNLQFNIQLVRFINDMQPILFSKTVTGNKSRQKHLDIGFIPMNNRSNFERTNQCLTLWTIKLQN